MTTLLIALTVAAVLVVAVIAALQLVPVRYRYRLQWQTGRPINLDVKRRVFPWGTDNVVFGSTLFAAHPDTLNDATLRHEGTHAYQYAKRGWWWVWTHAADREREAHAAERAAWPTIEHLEV